MKRKIISILLLFILVLLSSCKKEGGGDLRTITFKVRCNSPIAHVKVYPHAGTPTQYIIGSWEETFETSYPYASLQLKCLDDDLATMTIECYVDGKLIKTVSGRKSVELHYNFYH